MRKNNIVIISFIIISSMVVFGGYYTCPMMRMWNIACPGCGMTRAYISLFHGDISGAFYYHPLFMMPLFIVGMISVENRINRNVYNTIMIGCVVLFLGVYVYRLFTPGTLISLIK